MADKKVISVKAWPGGERIILQGRHRISKFSSPPLLSAMAVRADRP
jgi:hypothetical protein